MSDAPIVEIDPESFHADPYPALARMQAETPVAYVPQLGATLFTRRDDIFTQEKRIDIFSSYQPEGLMSRLMGENMMRKDGEAHQRERRAAFPALSPRTVRDAWLARFAEAADAILNDLAPRGRADLVADFARPLSGEMLRIVTGLSSFSAEDMDRASQAMIDGIANYAGDPATEARCREAVAEIDAHVDALIAQHRAAPESSPLHENSLIAVQIRAGLGPEQTRNNVKLAISGGQNEPRDAIAGTAWALLGHPEQLALIRSGKASWQQAFEEYARWIAPIGMSPRRIARAETVCGVRFSPEDRVFFMFGAANRDPAHFEAPERYDILRDTSPALSFGAGPHFCAGAAAARALICEIALPRLFSRLPGLRLAGEVEFAGWAFRGPRAVPVSWEVRS